MRRQYFNYNHSESNEVYQSEDRKRRRHMGNTISTCSEILKAFVDFWHEKNNESCREQVLQQICSTYYKPSGDSTEVNNCLESSGFHLFEVNTASTTYGFTTEEIVFTCAIFCIIILCIWYLKKRCGWCKRGSTNELPRFITPGNALENTLSALGTRARPQLMWDGRTRRRMPPLTSMHDLIEMDLWRSNPSMNSGQRITEMTEPPANQPQASAVTNQRHHPQQQEGDERHHWAEPKIQD